MDHKGTHLSSAKNLCNSSSSTEKSSFSSVLAKPKNQSASSECCNASSSASSPNTANTSSSEVAADSTRLNDFSALGVSPEFIGLCRRLGVETPTEIQRKSIPQIFNKQNVFGVSETGSGKTLCFVLPILHFLSKDMYGVFALVLTPSRELAIQIAEQFQIYGMLMNARIFKCIGGMEFTNQSISLFSKPHIVIGTPGRLADILRQNNEQSVLIFKYLQFLVLDEADKLMENSFSEDLKTIIEVVPTLEKLQILMFTATSFDLCKLPSGFSHVKFTEVFANLNFLCAENIKQTYVFIPSTVKFVYLIYFLQKRLEGQIGIVFVPTYWLCQLIATTLDILDISCVPLHSLLNQRRRIASLAKFRSEISRILVCTDIASRGLDIPQVNFVINYNVPDAYQTYVHRIGRTGRAKRGGLAITFVSFKSDVEKVHKIESKMNKKLELFETDESEVLKDLSKISKACRKATLFLHNIGFEEKTEKNRIKRKADRKIKQEK